MMNNTDYGEVLRDRYLDIYLSNTIVIVFGTVIGIFGNCIVIFFYLVRIQERGERYFIPLLAIVDLIGCLASSQFYIMDNTFFFNYPSDIVCRILTFLQAFVAGFSGHILVVICVQRYLLVCKPFGPKMTLFWKKVSFAIACLLSLTYTVPLIGISGIKTTDDLFLNNTVQTTLCKYYAVDTSTKITAYFGFLGLISVVNIIITAALFVPLLRRIQISLSGKKNVYYTNQDKNAESVSHSRKEDIVASNNEIKPDGHSKTRKDFVKKRITIMYFVIIITYIVSYLPSMVILILAYAIGDFNIISLTEGETFVWIYLSRFVFLNHIVNPFIYSYFDVKFRTELKTCFMRKR